ncbi:MAG: helix-turn-helix transcriptional regulator [Adhaeribacter sp.]
MSKEEENKLVQIRKHLGLTQKELAAVLGVKQGYISAIEQKKRPLSRSLKSLILEKFNIISVNWLLWDDGPIENENNTDRTYEIAKTEDILKEGFTSKYERLKKYNALINQYSEKFKYELENTNPDLYKLRQETDNFSYRAGAINAFYNKYLGKYSVVPMNWQFQVDNRNPDEISYQSYKNHMYNILEELKNLESLISGGNIRLKEILVFLKQFDSEGMIEDYILK